MKILHALKLQLKRWIIFNLFTFPFIAMFYVPYNLFFLQFTAIQLLKWVTTSAFLAAFFNIFYRPYVGFVTRLLDRRYGKAVQLPKITIVKGEKKNE